MFNLTCSLIIPVFSNCPCRGLLTEHEVLGIEDTLSIFISIPYWELHMEECGTVSHKNILKLLFCCIIFSNVVVDFIKFE